VNTIDWLLEADPVAATYLGDHRFDGLLPDLSDTGTRRLVAEAPKHRLPDAVDPAAAVDVDILNSRIDALVFERSVLRRQSWDPMVWNPGTALHLLVNRDFGDSVAQRDALLMRLAAVPDHLAAARQELSEMSGIHLETAIAQLHGTVQLIEGDVAATVTDQAAVATAVDAVQMFITWLAGQQDAARRSPRLGERRYAEALWYALDDRTSAVRMLEAAERHLDDVTARMREVAAEYLGESVQQRHIVRRALDDIARTAPVTAATIRSQVESALHSARGFIASHDLVGIPDVDVRVIDMPAIHRGVAVAYCDAPGPLETHPLPTFVAVAPPPDDWDQAMVESFYREYNGIALHDLTIHEAFPGHVLQLAHAQRTTSLARRFGMSGTFVEGWAVYAEELMVRYGYAPNVAARALELQQLKFQARMSINAILDVRVHTMEMTEEEAISLMTHRGFQEPGEVSGKWRRALLTAAQLPTYFVGYQAVRAIAEDVRVLHPNWTERQVNDAVLSQGSIAPRHVRTLLGI
jgi:hypothetical protein